MFLKVEGRKDQNYQFATYHIGSDFKQQAGVYIFVLYDNSDDIWRIVYIGQTSNFKNRICKALTQHHKWQDIKRYGATHVGLLAVDCQRARLKIEKELLRLYPTYCNKHLNYFKPSHFFVPLNLAAFFGVEHQN